MEAPRSVGSPKAGLSGRETVLNWMTAIARREDGCGDDGHPVGAAAGPAEDLPGLESRDASFDRCSFR